MLHKTAIKNIGLAVLLTASSSFALASMYPTTMLLKTSIEEVNGVRDIEAGAYQKGIDKTTAALSKLTVASQRAPLLNNLCVAYLAVEQYQLADEACNSAVNANQNNPISLNNRAVYHYLTGNITASLADLKLAAEGNGLKALIANNTKVLGQYNLLVKQ